MGSGPPGRQDKYQSAPVSRSRAGGPASAGRGQCPDRRAPRERLGHSPQSCGHLTPLRRVTGVRRAGPDGPSRCRTWLLARVVGVACCSQARRRGLFEVPAVQVVAMKSRTRSAKRSGSSRCGKWPAPSNSSTRGADDPASDPAAIEAAGCRDERGTPSDGQLF